MNDNKSILSVRQHSSPRKGGLNQNFQTDQEVIATIIDQLDTGDSELLSQDIFVEIVSSLSSIVNLNKAIMLNRLGKANQNIARASKLSSENGERLIRMFREFSELLKTDKSSPKAEFKSIKINQLLDEVYNKHLDTLKDKEIALQLFLNLPNEYEVESDPKILHTIFQKLINELCQAFPNGGKLEIKLEPSSNIQNYILSMTFEGSELSRKKTHSKNEKGILSELVIFPLLLKKYTQLLKGKSRIYVEAENRIRFNMLLPHSPISSESPKPVAVHHKAFTDQEIQKKNKPRGILVANDEYILEPLYNHLKESYKNFFAQNTQKAFEIIERYPAEISFIICAGQVPFENELEFIKRVKANPSTKNLPLLVVSDEVRCSLKMKAMQFKLSAYITEPFCFKELSQILQKELDLHSDFNSAQYYCNSAKSKCLSTPADLEWLEELEEEILKEMGNRHFNLSELAYRMAVSERQLFRKVKELTQKTPNKYLRDLRIYAAKRLLESYTYGTVAEISYAVGFQDPHYFSKIYYGTFKKWPSEYLTRLY
ncbi:MAG: helix-turn-helix domain-containing protein [Bacteroidia bacterium]|nr:helix-turn-helix domain-containing protein [Bacteroidia bacterium]